MSRGPNKDDPYKEISPLDRIRLGLPHLTPVEEDYIQPYDVAPIVQPYDQEKLHYKSLEERFATRYKQ